MRVIFCGTAEFAVPSLRALHDAGHTILAVITAPPRPAGRGRRLRASPVDTAARRLGLPVRQPENPNDQEFVLELAALRPEIGILVAYGCILSQRLLTLPRLGFINVHPSLLPAYRGAAPVPRCLMDGVTETGVTVIRMNRKVDAGDILACVRTPVSIDETAGELTERLSRLGADLLVKTLPGIADGSITGRTQDHTRATPAPKLTPADRPVEFGQSSLAVHNHIRALSPDPGALTSFRQRRLILLRSRLTDRNASGRPGSIQLTDDGFEVSCVDKTLAIIQLKPEGGKAMSVSDFCNGFHPRSGEELTPP